MDREESGGSREHHPPPVKSESVVRVLVGPLHGCFPFNRDSRRMNSEVGQIVAIFWTAWKSRPEIKATSGIAGSCMPFEGLSGHFAWHSDGLLPLVAVDA